MKRLYLIIALLVLILCVLPAVGMAQSLTGRVIDTDTRQPLVGANLSIVTTQTGTFSDSDGYFSLSVSDLPATLVVSYLGYETGQLDVQSLDQPLLVELQPVDAMLEQVTVTAYEGESRLLETPGSISAVSFETINRTGRVRISDVLNKIPGVRADQSDLSDTRISIRGAGFRSAFGVRNLRIYLNDIPITEADGFTRVEAIDLQNIGRVEAIRGPASSIYGAGLGGVLRFETMRSPLGTEVNIRSGSGSYGLQSNMVSLSNQTLDSNIRVSGGRQQYDGYRNHSSDNRLFLTANGSFYTARSTVSFLASVSNQQSEIPGALNVTEYLDDPIQADPQAEALDTGRDQRWTRLGVSHRLRMSENVEQRSSFFGSFYELDHPLAFAYLRNGQQNYGGRSVTHISHTLGSVDMRYKLGGEAIYQFAVGRRYMNSQGNAGNLISDLETSVTQWSLFAQAEADLSDRWTAVAGLSVNKFRYDVLDLLQSDDNDQTGVKSFDLAVSPRIGLLYLLNNDWALHGGVSYGFSPPTTNEVSLPDGTINTLIEAEKGINYEIGTRGTFFDQRLSVDLTGYLMKVDDELIPRSLGPGQTIYENAGQTSHRGVELSANAILFDNNTGLIRQIRPAVSYTYSDHIFKTFVVNDNDVSGNQLTGVAPHMINASLDLMAARGIYLHGGFEFVDRRPLTDSNSVFTDSYMVVDIRGGIESQLSSALGIHASIGVNNLFDEAYASRLSLNAASFGGSQPRYFNPSPGRNILFSIELSWNHNGLSQ